MTEAEWLACDDLRRMLAFVGPAATVDKMAAFASAYDRLLPRAPGRERPPPPPAGQAPWLFGVDQPAPIAGTWSSGCLVAALAAEVLRRAHEAPRDWDILPSWRRRELARRRCDLIRDIFSPFRTVTLVPGWLSANGGAARNLVASIYDEPAFEQLPILADALEDAGCAEAELLGHLRSPGPHVRGCWAIDLVLGKQ